MKRVSNNSLFDKCSSKKVLRNAKASKKEACIPTGQKITEEEKREMVETAASAMDVERTDAEMATSPPRPRRSHKQDTDAPSSPTKTNGSNDHVYNSKSASGSESITSEEHKPPSLEESSTHSNHNPEAGEASFIMMVHNMLQNAGAKTKEDFAKGIISHKADGKLQKIYAIETSRSYDETAGRDIKNAGSVGHHTVTGAFDVRSRGAGDSKVVMETAEGEDSIVGDLPNSKWFPSFGTPQRLQGQSENQNTMPPDPPSTHDDQEASDTSPPGFSGFVHVPETPPGFNGAVRVPSSHDVETQRISEESVVQEKKKGSWFDNLFGVAKGNPSTPERPEAAPLKVGKDEETTVPETPDHGRFARISASDSEGEEVVEEVNLSSKKSIHFALIHFVLLLVFLLAAIAGLSYYLWHLSERNQGASSPELVITISPTLPPSASPTTSAPTLSLSPTMSVEPTMDPTGTPTSYPTRRPTRPPTSPPTRSPTSYPTAETEQSYFMNLMARISPTTAMAMENRNSNHFRALRWLANDPDFYSYSDHRLLQRWVLVFFNLETQITPPPTAEPSAEPSALDSLEPTSEPSLSPTGLPTSTGSFSPSVLPSGSPSESQSESQSGLPNSLPTVDPFPDRRLNWNSLESWMQYTDECQWFSSYFFNTVACNSKKEFKRFVLINIGLEGTIPTELALLSKLETIALPQNNFVGTIPEIFGSMGWLQTFNVSYNELDGSIPEALSNAPGLGILDVGNNLLSGPVPSRICSMGLDVFRADCEEVDCRCCTRCAVALPTISDETLGFP